MSQLNNALPDNINISQCQYDALLSIVFNRGIGCESCGKNKRGKGFKGSELFKKIQENGIQEDIDYYKYIVNDDSKLSGSLRRKREAELFTKCKY